MDYLLHFSYHRLRFLGNIKFLEKTHQIPGHLHPINPLVRSGNSKTIGLPSESNNSFSDGYLAKRTLAFESGCLSIKLI